MPVHCRLGKASVNSRVVVALPMAKYVVVSSAVGRDKLTWPALYSKFTKTLSPSKGVMRNGMPGTTAAGPVAKNPEQAPKDGAGQPKALLNAVDSNVLGIMKATPVAGLNSSQANTMKLPPTW